MSRSQAFTHPRSVNVHGLARAATTGAIWTVVLSAANKVLTVACQLGLSYLLSPADFGLIGMAMSATAVAALFSGMQFKAVLFKNLAEFDTRLPQAFWLSALFGLMGAALLAGLAPLMTAWLGNARLLPLILVLAAAHFFSSLPAPQAAILSRDLRFREVACLQFGVGAMNNVGGLALAAAGIGPIAVFVAILCSSIFSCLAQWRLAGMVRLQKPQVRQWIPFLAPGFLLMLTSACTALGSYGANLIIGARYTPTVAGYFYWAFAISFQATFLLVTTLREIMFPALAHLNNDLASQAKAVRKSLSTLLAATVPICVLQVLLARPAITLVFGAKWGPAIPFAEVLTIGVMFHPLSMVANALFTARGEFKALLINSAASVAATLSASWLATFTGNPLHIAIATGVVSAVASLCSACYAMRLLQQPLRTVLTTSTAPLGLGVLALIVGLVIRRTVQTAWLQVSMCTVLTVICGYGGALLWVPGFKSLLSYYKRQPGRTVLEPG